MNNTGTPQKAKVMSTTMSQLPTSKSATKTAPVQPLNMKGSDITANLQQHLMTMAQRSNSPLRDMGVTGLSTLKNSGFLDFSIFKKLEEEDEQNRKPGIPIELKDIEKTFKMIDEKGGGQKISQAELKRRLLIMNPTFPDKDIGILTNNKNEIRAKDVYDLLKQNELSDYDPLAEAFKVLDPTGSGNIDITRLKKIFQELGYGDIDKKDLDILQECLDVDKDGKISLSDIRSMFDYLGRPKDVEFNIQNVGNLDR